RGIVFPGKSFFSAHEVSTCKISGCLSYRILDSGPDGTQTTLTL
ncbi:phosphatase, partial [Escherichia coli]